MSENVGCLGKIFQLFGLVKKDEVVKQNNQKLPYALRDDFLSPGELSFYNVLLTAVADKNVVVLTKVSLGDLFFVNSKDSKERLTYWNKINRKHVDYLICQSKTMKPLLGIELDDSSHELAKRQLRDEFVDEVFKVANLPLIHIKASNAYQLMELQKLLDCYFNKLQDKLKDDNITCPKCGVNMVIRESKKGQLFYGCPNFPHCRETKQI